MVKKKEIISGRTIYEHDAQNRPKVDLKKTEAKLDKHFSEIRTIRRDAQKKEISPTRQILFLLADIYGERHRLLDEKFCIKPTRFAGYIRERFGREDDETFYNRSFKLAKAAALIDEHPQLKPYFTDDVMFDLIGNLNSKILALAYKNPDIVKGFLPEKDDGQLDHTVLANSTVEQIEQAGLAEKEFVPWHHIKDIPDLTHKMDKKDIIIKIKSKDLRESYYNIIQKLDSRVKMRKVIKFLDNL